MALQWRDSETRYGIISKLFHWGMAGIVLYALFLGLTMEDIKLGPDKLRVIGLHKSLGITVMVLALLRWLWRIVSKAPLMPSGLGRGHVLLAKLGHLALYAIMVLLPLSGWLMSSARGFSVSVFGMGPLPNLLERNHDMSKFFRETHELLANGLMILLAAHVGAAVLHHFYHKNTILKRMLPWGKV